MVLHVLQIRHWFLYECLLQLTPQALPQMPLRPSVIPAMPGMPLPADMWQPNTKRAAAAKGASADASSGTGNKHPFLVILTKQQAMDIYSMRSPNTTRDPKLQVTGMVFANFSTDWCQIQCGAHVGGWPLHAHSLCLTVLAARVAVLCL